MTELSEALDKRGIGIPASWSEVENTRKDDGQIPPSPEYLFGGRRIIQDYFDSETGKKYRALFISQTESHFLTPVDIAEVD